MEDLADAFSEEWQELWLLTTQMQNMNAENLVSSHEGERREDGVINLPWVSYHPIVTRIEDLLYDLKVIQDIDWIQWKREIKSELVFDSERILSGSLYDTVCCLTGIIRSERFVTAAVAESLRIGVFVALLNRLRFLVT